MFPLNPFFGICPFTDTPIEAYVDLLCTKGDLPASWHCSVWSVQLTIQCAVSVSHASVFSQIHGLNLASKNVKAISNSLMRGTLRIWMLLCQLFWTRFNDQLRQLRGHATGGQHQWHSILREKCAVGPLLCCLLKHPDSFNELLNTGPLRTIPWLGLLDHLHI